MDKTLRLAFYRIIKALMRILYRKGVAFGEFTQLVKQAYVDVVTEELASDGGRVTTSRIAVVTGLTRKEVAQLRLQQDELPPPRFNRMLRVLNGWLHDPAFLGTDGKPADLPFRGGSSSFEQLVQCYSGDMSCFAMLDEMRRVKLVGESADGLVRLLSPVFVPQGEGDDNIGLLGVDVALLIATIDHNLVSEAGQRHYQRKVSYNNLPEEALPEFKAFVQKDAQGLLLRFNQWLYEHDRDSNPQVQGNGRMQAGVGIYYFEQPVRTKESGHGN